MVKLQRAASQAFAAQSDPASVMKDAIEDGRLTCDDQRAGVAAVLDDFPQVALLLRQQRLRPLNRRV